MAKGPEARFRDSVERYLSKAIYVEGMANPYRGGTPDRYYEGPSGVLWVEYKWEDNTLSELQERWLKRAQLNNVNVAIITGVKFPIKGGYILRIFQYRQSLRTNVIYTRKEIAQWIERQVNGHTKSRKHSRKTD